MENKAGVKITADTTEFHRNLTRATGALREFSGAAASSFTGFTAGAATMAAVGAGMALVARNAINMADSISKAAQKTGASTESLSALRVAAELSDVSFDELQSSFFKLSKAMAAGVEPGSEQALLFERIGVAVTDANGKLRSTDAVFADIAEVFKRLPDGAEKTAIAMELFGKSGANMIPLLNGGKAALEEFHRTAERWGVLVSEQVAKDAEQFNDNLTGLGKAAQGAGLQFSSGMLPALKSITSAMLGSVKAGDDMTFWGKTAGTVLMGVAKAAVYAGAVIKNIGFTIGALAAMAKFVLTGEFAKASDVWTERNKDMEKNFSDMNDTLKALNGEIQHELPKTAEAMQESAIKSAAAMKLQAKTAKETTAEQIKDTQRLRDAVRKAGEESLAEAKKFAEEAKKLRESAADKKQSRADQADEKRAGTLSEDDQETRNAQKARSLALDADILSGKAYLDALAGKNEDAALKAEQALKLAEKAAGFADKVKNANLSAGLLEQIGEIEAYTTNVQAGIAQGKADAAAATAQAQLKLADELSAKLTALEEKAKSIKVGFDTGAAESQLAAIREKASQPITIPVQVGGGAAPEIQSNARGGLIRGPGSDTSDNLLSWLSPGEYVIRAAAVRKYSPAFLSALNNMNLPAFANGGAVSRLSMPSLSSGRGGSSMAPTVFNFPGMGRFDAQVTPDTLAAIRTAFSREALRKGRR